MMTRQKWIVSSVCLLALLGLLSCTKASSRPQYIFKDPPKTGIVAKFGNVEISEDELVSEIKGDLYDKEMELYDIKFNRLRAVILEKLVNADPRKKGLTNDQFMDKYIGEGRKPSDRDVDAFLKKMQVPDKFVNPQYRERVKAHLELEMKKEAVEEWVAKQTGGKGIEVYFAKPKRPSFPVVVGNAPVFGDKNAKVTIVEYSDFQCPHCKNGALRVGELKAKYGKKIQVAFKNFPLPFHAQAMGAAEAGLCANEQGSEMFWKMHDAMFDDQSKLALEELKKLAKKIGLKEKDFAACLDGHKFAKAVNDDMEEAKKNGVQATPTFFVNGKLVAGAQPIEAFSEIIDEELK